MIYGNSGRAIDAEQSTPHIIRTVVRFSTVLTIQWFAPESHERTSHYFVRGEKVTLDPDLAALYGVETKVLNRAVRKGDLHRFPADFMPNLLKVKEKT